MRDVKAAPHKAHRDGVGSVIFTLVYFAALALSLIGVYRICEKHYTMLAWGVVKRLLQGWKTTVALDARRPDHRAPCWPGERHKWECGLFPLWSF